MKSQFDSGNWSKVNGLPGQDDIIYFLQHLFNSNPNECYTRRNLMDLVIVEFNIPLENAMKEGPNSDTSSFYTRLTYLITDGLQGKRKSDKPFAKRLSRSIYQSINGDGIITNLAGPVFCKPPERKEVNMVVPSVRILKTLNYSPEKIRESLIPKWNLLIINAAINRVFRSLAA